ncbi:MAG: hypothetical protein ACP5QA_07445 [Phycisphaerae bacterium]
MLQSKRRIFQLVGADEISRAAAAEFVTGGVGVGGVGAFASVMVHIMA